MFCACCSVKQGMRNANEVEGAKTGHSLSHATQPDKRKWKGKDALPRGWRSGSVGFARAPWLAGRRSCRTAVWLQECNAPGRRHSAVASGYCTTHGRMGPPGRETAHQNGGTRVRCWIFQEVKMPGKQLLLTLGVASGSYHAHRGPFLLYQPSSQGFPLLICLYGGKDAKHWAPAPVEWPGQTKALTISLGSAVCHLL